MLSIILYCFFSVRWESYFSKFCIIWKLFNEFILRRSGAEYISNKQTLMNTLIYCRLLNIIAKCTETMFYRRKYTCVEFYVFPESELKKKKTSRSTLEQTVIFLLFFFCKIKLKATVNKSSIKWKAIHT